MKQQIDVNSTQISIPGSSVEYKAIYFKALQMMKNYRNTEQIDQNSAVVTIPDQVLKQALLHLQRLISIGVKFTYPGDFNYPQVFNQMIERPLFLEYIGSACWNDLKMISVVGSRDCHDLTDQWINSELLLFLKNQPVGLVSGGARGVDFKSHLVSLKAGRPTIVVLPSGLGWIYPKELYYIQKQVIEAGGAFISEFDYDSQIRKSYFYHRNRLIAALGQVCLVAQASTRSGTMLTVHHSLQNGRPVITIPAHPGLVQFSGNIKLMSEGAPFIVDATDLNNFWTSEAWSS